MITADLEYDTNMDTPCTHWSLLHAIREFIANAIDEQRITGCADSVIEEQSAGCWTIRDFGRGLRPEHLKISENSEKTSRKDLCGQFGYGFKDAACVCYNNGVKLAVTSTHMILKVYRGSKVGFPHIPTIKFGIKLAVRIEGDEPLWTYDGTVIQLKNVPDGVVEAARNLFVLYRHMPLLYRDEIGEMYQKDTVDEAACIFMNGQKVSEEEGLSVHYNFTKPTKTMRSKFNRERMDLSITTYSDQLQRMLTHITDGPMADILITAYESKMKKSEIYRYKSVRNHVVEVLIKPRLAAALPPPLPPLEDNSKHSEDIIPSIFPAEETRFRLLSQAEIEILPVSTLKIWANRTKICLLLEIPDNNMKLVTDIEFGGLAVRGIDGQTYIVINVDILKNTGLLYTTILRTVTKYEASSSAFDYQKKYDERISMLFTALCGDI